MKRSKTGARDLACPKPGLVIRYSYLWHQESQSGQEEGVKDRPCAVVIALEDDENRTRVLRAADHAFRADLRRGRAIEIPAVVKSAALP